MNASDVVRRVRAPSGWLAQAVVAATQHAHECFVRAGARQSEAQQAARGESMRFMNDLSGGGSRVREAARSLAPGSNGARSGG